MLPAAASLSRQGANKGATTAFLISTPESGIDSIAVSYALLDPLLTVIRPVAALFTALLAGISENLLFWKKPEGILKGDRSCPVDGCCDGIDCPPEVHSRHHTWGEKLRAGLRFGYKEVWGDIVGWFYIGVALAALITVLVPDDILPRLLGGGLNSMLVMLVVGIPLYICATASTPVAAALILKGVSPGAALVFLLVGPATNITSLSVLVKILGKRSTALYLVVLSAGAVGFGLLVDKIYAISGIDPRAVIGGAGETVPVGLRYTAFAILVLLSVGPLYQQLKKRFFSKPKPQTFVSPFPVSMAVHEAAGNIVSPSSPTSLHNQTGAQSGKEEKSHGCSCCGHH